MPIPAWTKCSRVVLLLVALVRMVEVGAKVNSIRSAGPGEIPATPTDRSAGSHAGVFKKGNSPVQMYPCSNDKECSVGSYCHVPHGGIAHCASCRRKKRRCQRDSMCCPGNLCTYNVCLPISETVLSPQIPALEDHNKLSTKGSNWKKIRKMKISIAKGHEGDPCLRSSDCTDGYCCARHFWTKICKPVMRQGEVCTRQRRKGSHGLELFQRCDCAKGLSCKVWMDGTSGSNSRLHVCQRP